MFVHLLCFYKQLFKILRGKKMNKNVLNKKDKNRGEKRRKFMCMKLSPSHQRPRAGVGAEGGRGREKVEQCSLFLRGLFPFPFPASMQLLRVPAVQAQGVPCFQEAVGTGYRISASSPDHLPEHPPPHTHTHPHTRSESRDTDLLPDRLWSP